MRRHGHAAFAVPAVAVHEWLGPVLPGSHWQSTFSTGLTAAPGSELQAHTEQPAAVPDRPVAQRARSGGSGAAGGSHARPQQHRRACGRQPVQLGGAAQLLA
eukprot:8390-Chlamydomonas_euryale.AAC.1